MRAVLLTVLGFVLSGFAAREWLAHWTLDARMVFCALISLACLFAYLFVSGSANDPERQGGGPGGPGSIV